MVLGRGLLCGALAVARPDFLRPPALSVWCGANSRVHCAPSQCFCRLMTLLCGAVQMLMLERRPSRCFRCSMTLLLWRGTDFDHERPPSKCLGSLGRRSLALKRPRRSVAPEARAVVGRRLRFGVLAVARRELLRAPTLSQWRGANSWASPSCLEAAS